MGGLTRPAVRKRLTDAAGTVGEWLTDVPDVSRRLGELAGRIVECEVQEQPPDIRSVLRRDEHLLCGLLAKMAAELARVARLPGVAGEATADSAFPGKHKGIDAIQVEIMKAALKKVIAKTFELTGTNQLHDVVRVLRCAALAACPNVDNHPDVRTHCEAPLTEEAASEAVQASLCHAIREQHSGR